MDDSAKIKGCLVFLKCQSGLSYRTVQQSFLLHHPSDSISLWLLVLPCCVVQWHFLLMTPFWRGGYGTVFKPPLHSLAGLVVHKVTHEMSTLWFLQSEYLPWRVRKTHMFKININKTDPLISWLALIGTQITWIHPILVTWSSQTCGFFRQMIENLCLIWNLQIIGCFSLLMDQRETWLYDHNFYGCFAVWCLRWLVLIIFLYYKTCKL